jgi:hypothetical protein
MDNRQMLLDVIGFCETGGSQGDLKLWIARHSLLEKKKKKE